MVSQKMVIALPLEEKLLPTLQAWGHRYDWTSTSEVHFLHIVKKSITPIEFGLMEMPDEKTFREMSPTLHRFLEEQGQRILPRGFGGMVFFHLALDFNPDEKSVEFLKDIHASLIVVATQGKHGFEGLFHSSFSEHMVRFAPCDVYVVKPT